MLQRSTYGEVVLFRLARGFLGRGVYFTASYLVDGLVVDTGCRHTLAEFAAATEGVGIHTVINTHSHEDHIAGNALLQRRDGARILAHELALPVLADPRGTLRMALYEHLAWGMPEPSIGQPIPEEVCTSRHRFRVLRTPGHSVDHLCLYEPEEGWLFTGDLFIGGRDRALREDGEVWRIIASLEMVAGLEVRRLFPGSGSVRENPLPELRAKIVYLRELGERVLTLSRAGQPPQVIRKTIFGREHPLAFFSGGSFSGLHLVRSFLNGEEH